MAVRPVKPSLIASVAVRAPMAAGVNDTPTAHDAPGANVRPEQPSVSVISPTFGPLSFTVKPRATERCRRSTR